MGIIKKQLTDREKAVLYWLVFSNSTDWRTAYKMASDQPLAYYQDFKYLDTYVSKWKNSELVRNEVEKLQYLKQRQAEKIKEEAIEEYKTKGEQEEERREKSPKARGGKMVDYSDPKAQRQKLNELVNNAEDSKEALDALKTIIASQRDDREGAKAQKAVTAYLPMTCKECPLYEKALKRNTLHK